MNLLAFCLLLIGGAASTSTPPAAGEIIRCSDFLICNEKHRSVFEKRREMALRLIRYHEEIQYSGYVSNGTLYEEALRYRTELCDDASTAGYMLQNGTEHWPMACIWNGAGTNGTEVCAPYPFKGDSIFDFVETTEWRTQVIIFRRNIGCSDAEIYNVRKIDENYFCRERCIVLGIGYFPQLIIMTSLIFALYITVLSA